MRVIYTYFALIVMILSSCAKSVATNEKQYSNSFHQRTFGASAYELLSDKKYTSLKVEIQYMPGFEPDEEALVYLHNFLKTYLHKPKGITIVTKEILPEDDTEFSIAKVSNIEKLNRTAYTTGSEIAVYVLYTNGVYTDKHMLGLAYRNTSVVVFGKKIKEFTNNFRKINRTRFEATLLLHEMGHLLGLVNTGASMQTNHKDSEQGQHCNNKSCLMYYAPAKENPFIYLMKYKVPQLDADCIADLRAYGAR